MTTSPSSISDAAVHAALNVLPYQAADYVDMDYMRAALEAAAPYMLGAAWAEGCRKGLGTNPGWEDEVLARNPYRTTK